MGQNWLFSSIFYDKKKIISKSMLGPPSKSWSIDPLYVGTNRSTFGDSEVCSSWDNFFFIKLRYFCNTSWFLAMAFNKWLSNSKKDLFGCLIKVFYDSSIHVYQGKPVFTHLNTKIPKNIYYFPKFFANLVKFPPKFNHDALFFQRI